MPIQSAKITCTHFLLFFVGPYRAVGTICNDRRIFPYAAGALEAPPPAGLGQRSGGGPRTKPLGAPEIWHLNVQTTAQKTQLCGSVSLYKMNLKEKIIHLMFQTRKITRWHKYSQAEVENSKVYFAFVHN